MDISPNNLIFHELIGLFAEVSASTNSSLVGIKGKVVDETRNLLVIENKKIPKSCSTFVFSIPNNKVKVDGKLLVSRPEDRIKRRLRGGKRW
ncbi:MAG: ribonuclease P protein component 1 [Methanocellales archaeon]|nr:ribonuclease P protein component 1 [Methanocellales archaeon]MDD3291130.1 ribonuclease P protein component 1 [Methanocellales archaeon]MDD5484614.1 ribonuclease P protein component 1 [Methanocellales archaeon]